MDDGKEAERDPPSEKTEQEKFRELGEKLFKEQKERKDRGGGDGPGDWKEIFDAQVDEFEKIKPGARKEVEASIKAIEQHWERHPELREKLLAQLAAGQSKGEQREMVREFLLVIEAKQRKERERKDREKG